MITHDSMACIVSWRMRLCSEFPMGGPHLILNRAFCCGEKVGKVGYCNQMDAPLLSPADGWLRACLGDWVRFKLPNVPPFSHV